MLYPTLAAGAIPPGFGEITILAAVSVAIAYVCYRLKLVPIAGFLIAGVIIGPSALGLVDDIELVNTLAEIGVILLLFTIGIEFSLDKLARIKRLVLGGGALQVFGTMAVVTGICLALGVDWRSALFTSGLVALSSTAIVLGLLSDRGETDTPVGQSGLGILIFQDFGIIVMVLLVPLIGGGEGSTLDLLLALGKALLIIAVVVVLARKVIPPLLARVAATRRNELFLLTVVALCFLIAWIMGLADVSLALGAFLAGLIVSESPYATQALSEVLPLRTVFNAAFFVSVGMLLDVRVLLDAWPLVLGAAAVVLVLKLVITSVALLIMKMPLRIAVASGLMLAQIGEFSFVLDIAGRDVGLSPMGLGNEGQQVFIATTVLLMLLTPFMASVGGRVGRAVQDVLGPLNTADLPDDKPIKLEDHVIIVGYGPAGRRLARVLRQTDIPFVIIDLNPQSIREAREEGLNAVYGDATRPHVLEVAGIEHAKLCVVVISDRDATERTVHNAAFENPTLQIIARADFLDDVDRLHKAGAEIVIPTEIETAVRLFGDVLHAYRVPSDEVNRHIREVRANDYRLICDPELPASDPSMDQTPGMVLDGLSEEGLHTRTVTVRDGAAAAGRTLGELALRQDYDLTVIAIRRNGDVIGSPDGSEELLSGDRLVLVGPAAAFAGCADIFRFFDEPDIVDA
ncbi:cation:proton antiporter [Longibacter salinarum]|uniref:cation:proton antiporter domain-containing protein n=1 Tax=Longibacter salinarum TaxID=1850348 RepID=UPI001FEA81FF|nr:cation:proton antiporter [Longibacter salinarum]